MKFSLILLFFLKKTDIKYISIAYWVFQHSKSMKIQSQNSRTGSYLNNFEKNML